MNKNINVKVSEETHSLLQLLADEKEEGNLSLLMRKIVKEYLEKGVAK